MSRTFALACEIVVNPKKAIVLMFRRPYVKGQRMTSNLRNCLGIGRPESVSCHRENYGTVGSRNETFRYAARSD